MKVLVIPVTTKTKYIFILGKMYGEAEAARLSLKQVCNYFEQ